MKLTIAEAELLRGKEQRTAAALDAIARDMANANVPNAQPTPTYTAQAPDLFWYSAFDEYGRIRSCIVTDPKEVERRTLLHDQMVLPEPSDQRGYVFTRLDAFGSPGKTSPGKRKNLSVPLLSLAAQSAGHPMERLPKA